MEEELRCPICKQLYSSPVLLPCYHALCLSCALDVQTTASSASAMTSTIGQLQNLQLQNQSIHSSHHHSSSSAASTASSTASASESVSSDNDQADKVSILSEADSGVVCHTSRPGSYASTPNLQAILFSPSAGAVFSLTCPICRKTVFFDEGGVRNLPPYRAMESIVDRFCAREALRCQMCETEPKVASLVCEQCDIRYCDGCRELCHPARGPLAKHTLVKPRGSSQVRESICSDHSEPFHMYCTTCKIPICSQCMLDNKHQSHELQPISTICKAQKATAEVYRKTSVIYRPFLVNISTDLCSALSGKTKNFYEKFSIRWIYEFSVTNLPDNCPFLTELSHNLQKLSEKARSTTEFIQRLKGMSDKVTESCIEYEELVTAQCEALIQAIHDRREVLLEAIRMDRDTKIRILKDQQQNCTGKIQQTTGLIQFCIEALKETDSAVFLQIGPMLINRVANIDMTWHQEVTNAAPRVSPIVNYALDDVALSRAIDNLNFSQIKTPLAPTIIPEGCSAENNSVTVAWKQPLHSNIEGYVLELDDGNGGEFREVYCGKETICTVDGLHFNSMYNARVKAFNSSGEGEYSELIGLQTAEVAWFTFDPQLSGGPGSGLIFTNNNSTVSVEGWEHRVALGSVGFSRGIHYWEFTIDRYTADTDPAFGVARIDVSRDKMLGKDEKAFAMYIDRQRSWFQHNSVHERRVEGGISTGSTIGVLLDLERHTLSFLVNEMPQGSVAFRDLYGVFYPAVSINRGVTLTLHTTLYAPHMDYH